MKYLLPLLLLSCDGYRQGYIDGRLFSQQMCGRLPAVAIAQCAPHVPTGAPTSCEKVGKKECVCGEVATQ